MNYTEGCFVGRVWNTAQGGPCLVTIKDNYVYDITSKEIPIISVPTYISTSVW